MSAIYVTISCALLVAAGYLLRMAQEAYWIEVYNRKARHD